MRIYALPTVHGHLECVHAQTVQEKDNASTSVIAAYRRMYLEAPPEVTKGSAKAAAAHIGLNLITYEGATPFSVSRSVSFS